MKTFWQNTDRTKIVRNVKSVLGGLMQTVAIYNTILRRKRLPTQHEGPAEIGATDGSPLLISRLENFVCDISRQFKGCLGLSTTWKRLYNTRIDESIE